MPKSQQSKNAPLYLLLIFMKILVPLNFRRTRPKGKKHWKRAEKLLKEAEQPKPEKVIKKRRTQKEMKDMHAQNAQLAQRTSRRSATVTNAS